MYNVKTVMTVLLIAFALQATCQSITYLGNDGLFIEYQGNKLIIDGLYSDPSGRFDSPSSDVTDGIISGVSPYDKISASLLTHAHPDHFDATNYVDFLKSNKSSTLICTPQTADSMKLKSDFYKEVADRIIVNPWVKGWKSNTLGTITVKSAYTRHAGKLHGKVQNQVFIIQIGDKKILHVAYSQMDVSQFDNLRLTAEDIDIAIVPFWFLTNLYGSEIISKHVGTKKIIGMHLPLKLSENAMKKINNQFPEATVFTETNQSVSF